MINPFFSQLTRSYIFSQIEEKLLAFRATHPQVQLINLSVGDIALPLAPSLARAIQEATEEMTTPEGIRGYGPSEGYRFLREAICTHEYQKFSLSAEEIFISDGTNSDAVHLPELFDPSITIGVPDPAYPAYRDASILAGKKVLSLPCVEKEGFCPLLPKEPVSLVYLCSPNNPTGIALSKEQLKRWIDWAHTTKAIIALDNVYNCFAISSSIPASIYEIPGAHEVAIEMRSFSKMAGFTGLRCAYMVIPKTLHLPLHALWIRRVNAKSNGVAYPIQKGAFAFYTPQGRRETRAQIAVYQKSAEILREGLKRHGYLFYGGQDAPYIWIKTPGNLNSWEFFDQLLDRCHILAIPGSGFGPGGEGYIRLSCFTRPEVAEEAVGRLENHSLLV
jgi:LL-diaminopimelate aminotransferase